MHEQKQKKEENISGEKFLYSREEYAKKNFWEDRYKDTKKTYFDWYAEFPELKATFQEQYCIEKQNHILMLGCGNSKLSDQMYEAGYHNILNIDISPAVIEQMKEASDQKGYDPEKMRWEVMDATDMPDVKDNSIDVIIDKGTLDALISGSNIDICVKMLKQSMRVLKKEGQFILVTYGSPEGRKKLFQSAIGFKKFDYYTTKVDLSTESTLINLMRGNLGKQPLHAITKDIEAFKKSMMEFNLIKVLRRNRKNEKKFIVWDNYEKKEQKVNLEQFQEKKQSVMDSKEAQQKEEQTVKSKSNNQSLSQRKMTEESQLGEDKKVIKYNPMKQTFCFVYSIKYKFASDLQQIVSQIVSEEDLMEKGCSKIEGGLYFPGDQSLKEISLFAEGEALEQIYKAIVFIKMNEISNNPVRIFTVESQFKKLSSNSALKVQLCDKNYSFLYSKCVLNVRLPISNGNFRKSDEAIRSACKEIMNEGELSVHPTPSNYEYMGVLMQKLGKAHLGLSKFLNQYWYPTWKVISADFETNKVAYSISLPPGVNPEQCQKIIAKICRVQPENIQFLRKGVINEVQPRILGIMKLCTVSLCNGKDFQLAIEEFGNESLGNNQTFEPTISLTKEILAKSMARLFSSF